MKGVAARFRHRLGTFELDAEVASPGRGITAIVGASGSGKSTLLRCIAGLEHAAAGRLEVNGEVWQDSERRIFLPPHRRRLGFVFQHANLFPHLSVRRNLEYGWRRAHVPPGAAAFGQTVEMLALAPLMERRPATLSGGERQRVALGRALLSAPELLLMDEPLSSLDAPAKREIWPYVEQLHRALDLPILYVSHDLQEVARLADRAVLISRGRNTVAGALSDVLTHLDFSLPHGEQALASVEARVERHDRDSGLTHLRFPGGTLRVSLLTQQLGQAVRVGIMARDVSLTLSRHTDTSILNVFPAQVAECRSSDNHQVLVRLRAGESTILACVSRHSAGALGLAPGMTVHAQVKSVALLA